MLDDQKTFDLKKACNHLLEAVEGEESNREGLLDTPRRFESAWRYWTKGYEEDPASILKVFEDGAANYDEMVLVRDIPVYSKCEHHLADIFGVAHVAYIPNGRIVGLSKLSRLVDCFARRLQVQERLTTQIADSLVEHLQPRGVLHGESWHLPTGPHNYNQRTARRHIGRDERTG
jgi:GTP cyclohydrolase I